MAKKILIIEDYQATVGMITSFLQIEGYEVVTANDGPSGLEKAAADKPDLILLDVMMPGMSGIEVCQKLKQDRRTAPIPVIIVSIKCNEQEIAEGRAAGAVDYLVKPFELDDLRAALKKQLG